jgi:tryptophan 2,3-dioxygenase
MATIVLLALGGAASCRGSGRPDVAGFEPLLEEDGNLVTLLNEAMDLGERDHLAAARNLRDQVVVRARRNAEAAGALRVSHPRARALRTTLCQLTARRAETTEALAGALESQQVEALSRTLRAMRQLAGDMEQLERDVQRARSEPAPSGCAL